MKQLFLKSLLWLIQTTGKGVVALIRFLTCTPVLVALLLTNGLFAASDIVTGAASWTTALNVLAVALIGLSLWSRKPSAETEAAPTFEEVVDEATRIRDNAVTELSAEAQAVVDRIRLRTDSFTIHEADGTTVEVTPKAMTRRPRATTIVEENGLPTIKPKRPRK